MGEGGSRWMFVVQGMVINSHVPQSIEILQWGCVMEVPKNLTYPSIADVYTVGEDWPASEFAHSFKFGALVFPQGRGGADSATLWECGAVERGATFAKRHGAGSEHWQERLKRFERVVVWLGQSQDIWQTRCDSSQSVLH
eukprot:39043-Amphidinium_carterae.1